MEKTYIPHLNLDQNASAFDLNGCQEAAKYTFIH